MQIKVREMQSLTTEYKNLVNHILEYGVNQDCRNGKQLIIPHYSFALDFTYLDSYKLKLRKMFYKGVLGEFNTLISNKPLTNVSQFEANGCNYWKSWAGQNGELNLDYYNELHPALTNVINQIKEDPYSRRHVISLWNNEHAFDGSLSLHCCWHNLTFSIIDDTLHLSWTQRSVDVMVGLPSDIYLAYLFMTHICSLTNYKRGTCMFNLSNVHIYGEHIEGAHELLSRTEEDFDKPLKFELKA
jgi:thymidylate synthase